MTREVEALVAALDDERAGVLKKLVGLSEMDARRTTVPSGTNLAGLLQHLTFVEAKWFESIVGGRSPSRGQRSMDVDPSVSLKTLRADSRAACEASTDCQTYRDCVSLCTSLGGCLACDDEPEAFAGRQLLEAYELCIAAECLSESWIP